MALLHGDATITPSKLEMLADYVATLPQLADALDGDVLLLGAYRFDDPAKHVGIETHLLQAGSGPVMHIPLTYRDEALAGAEDWLLGTMEHSVLGQRWVYNGCCDPIYVSELARTILTGDTQVELEVETADGRHVREPTTTARGSGAPGADVPAIESCSAQFDSTDTVIRSGDLEIVVRNVIGQAAPADSSMLIGTWPGTESPTTLAFLR